MLKQRIALAAAALCLATTAQAEEEALIGFEVMAPQTALEVLLSARHANICIKVSGLPYCSLRDWDFPYRDTHGVLKAEYEHYGPQRLFWGSDYPMVLAHMTYRQSLEAFRTHCTFIPEDERKQILGDALNALLSRQSSHSHCNASHSGDLKGR